MFVEPYIETERLVLKPLSVEDAADVFQWVADPEVNRFMIYPLYQNLEQVKSWLCKADAHHLEFGYYLKSNGKCIGSGGIGKGKDGIHELGYNLNRDYWHQGYATEAAKAMIAWAYRELGVHDFVASHAKANIASGRVIQKCGFQYDHEGEYSKFDGSATFPASYYTLHLD